MHGRYLGSFFTNKSANNNFTTEIVPSPSYYLQIKRLGQIENYNGIYKERASHNQTVYVRSESIRERSALFNWNIDSHLHTGLFQIFFIFSGYADLKMTAGEERVHSPALIWIPAGHVHAIKYDPEVTGHILTVDIPFLEQVLTPVIHMFRKMDKICCINHFETEIPFEYITDLVQQIDVELSGNREERYFVVQALIGILVVNIFRLQSRSPMQADMTDTSERYFHDFQKSFFSSPPFSKSIPEFARELHISTVHLNRICRKLTGRSASQLLQEHAVGEARKLLVHTSNSVSEIAYKLNFTDPGYLARLFKKITGVSPAEFRKRAHL
jgi:AraC family transcriptional regulator, transcriptional activator of pobA